MKKSRVWQAIVPGTQNKPQDTLQIRKTTWHGVTKQPPAVPLPGPNVTPEPNEKSRVWQAIVPGHTKQATRHPSNQENTLARRNETASCRPLPGPNVTPEPNEKIKGLAGNCSRHTKQATRCFPDLKGVLWLVLCGLEQLPARPLIFHSVQE